MPTDLQESTSLLPNDLERYRSEPQEAPPPLRRPEQVEPADAALMAGVGVTRERRERTGTYIQRDFYPLCLVAWSKQLELLPLAAALERYDWLAEHFLWRAVPADFDAVTARCAAAPQPQGFFIRVKKGAKIALPVEACLYMTQGDILQMVHNVIILEEGAELNLITGCTIHQAAASGVHLGVTENYVGANASLTCTMVHSWAAETVVRPRVGSMVAQGGRYVDTYCSLRPARSVESQPHTWLEGAGAVAKHLTIVLGSAGSVIDMGGEVHLNGRDSRAELAHRAVCTGGAIYQRGLLLGRAPCRAHVDCAGLVLEAGEQGFIQSTPGLKALHPDAQMSHEASIGKIAPEQVEYLQTRGLEEREAISLIVRGFLGAEIIGLGAELDRRIAELTELAGHGEP